MIVAAAFGLLMGWGMTRRIKDLRPFYWATVVGTAAGIGALTMGWGDQPEIVGGSLVIGCLGGLTGGLVSRSSHA